MTKALSKGGSTPVQIPKAKGTALQRFGVPPLKLDKLAPQDKTGAPPGKAEYELLLGQVETKRTEIVNLKELADPTEINRLIEKAKGMTKDLPQFVAAKLELEKIEPIYLAQKNAAETKKADKAEFNRLLLLAKAEVPKVVAPADPAPLNELIHASEGLGEHGQYAAAKVKIQTYPKLVETLNAKGREEPGKEVKYKQQLQIAKNAVQQLTTGELKDFSDPNHLQKLIDAATIHEKAGRFASALEALGDCTKVAEQRVKAAQKKKTEKEEYEALLVTSRRLKNQASCAVAGEKGNIIINCATELFVMETAAGRQATLGQFAEACKTLANVQAVGAKAIKKKEANVAAHGTYATKLRNAKDKRALLHPPLADVETLDKIIFDAERHAEKGEFAKAGKLLDGADKEYAKQQKLEAKQGPLEKEYQKALLDAKTLLTNLGKVPLAETEPLDQLVVLAESLAKSGNYELATKTLARRATISSEETEKARGQAAAQTDFEREFKLAEAPLTELLKLGDVADPKALQAQIDLGRKLGSSGKFASALEAIKGWKAEGETRTTEANERLKAKGVYDAKLNEAKSEVAKVTVDRYKKGLEKAIADAEGMAVAAEYDKAVAKLEMQITAAGEYQQEALRQKSDSSEYTRKLSEANKRIAELEKNEFRSPDAELVNAKKGVGQAEQFAGESQYLKALTCLESVARCLENAELAAQNDEDKATEYWEQKPQADRELVALIKLGPTVTTEPLAEIIALADAKAKRGLFAEAFTLIQPHTAKYNELVQLQAGEAGKLAEYGKQLPLVNKNLLALQGTPHAEASEMEALVNQAIKEAAAGKFASACLTLVEAQKEFVNQNSLALQETNEEKTIAKAEPKFNNRREAVEKLLAELLLCPGTEDAVEAIRADLRTGDNAAKNKDFKTGKKLFKKTIAAAKEAKKKSSESLDKVGECSGVISKDYGDIKGLSSGDEKKITAAGKEFKEARSTVESSLNNFRAVATPDQVKEFEKRIVAANTQVLAAKKEKKADAGLKLMNEGIAELRKIALEIAGDLSPLSAAKDDCSTLSKELEQDLQSLWVMARAEEVQPLQVRFNKLQLLLSAQEFEAAKLKLETLQTDIAAKTSAVTKDSNDWATAEKELGDLSNAINIYLNDPFLQKAALALRDQVANIKEILVKKEKNYRQAVEEVASVKDQLSHFEGSRQQIVEFGPAREEADKEVKAASEKIAHALRVLKKTMKKADPTKDRSPVSLEKEHKAIMDAWALRAAKAPDEATLNKAGALKALKDLGKDIAGWKKFPAMANKAVDEEQAAAEFETARTAADKALEPVRARGGNEAAALDKEFAGFLKSAPDDYAKATLGMNDIKSRAEGLVAQLDNERLAAVVKARSRATAAVAEIVALQKGLKQWFPTSSDLGQEFADFFEDQKTQIAALEGLREGGNLKAIASAEMELDQIMSRTRVAAADARSETEGGSSFKTVLKRRKAIEVKLKSSALKKCTPSALEKLQKEFTELSDKTKSQEPSEAMAALIKFDEGSVTPAVQAADRAVNLRNQITTKATEALAALKPLKASAPEYYDKLLKQLKKAKKDGKQEKGEQSALTLIGTLKGEIDKAALLPPAELAGKEKGAKEQKETGEKDQLAWHSNRDIFDQTSLPAASTAVSKHPEGDATQIDDLKKLREKAGKAAKAGDYLGATQQIKAAIVVAERVQKAPQGVKTTSRNNLPAVETGWKNAVKAVKEGIDKVEKAIKKVAEEEPEAIKELKAINTALDHLKQNAFDTNAFGDVVKVLGAKGNKPAERRAARELALRTVREYRATVKDPVMMVLFKANPFAKVPLNQIKAALDDLDLNIQRSV